MTLDLTDPALRPRTPLAYRVLPAQVFYGWYIASGLGPFAVGVLEDATGSYNASFVVTSIVTFAAAGIVLLARPVMPEAVEAERIVEAAS